MPRIALGAFAVLAMSLPSPAATLRVPSEYPTIQAGVDAAADGDTVLVAPGTYHGAPGSAECVRLDKGIALISEAGADFTVVDGEGARRVLTSTTTSPRTIRGFTIRNGSATNGAGLYLTGIGDETHTIGNNVFEGNHASGSGGGLYYLTWDGTAVVQGNVFRGNTDGGNAAAAWFDVRTVDFDSNVVVENGPGYAIRATLFYAQLNVTNCVIANNGNGIKVFPQCGDVIVVRNSTFAGSQWAIVADAAVSLNVSETVIVGDIYGAVSNLDCDPRFTFDHVDLLGNLTLSCCEDDVTVTWNQPNLNADPQFCAPGWNDFTLAGSSPCLPQNNPWGVLIGARGQGCIGPVSLRQESWGAIKARYR